MKLFPRALLASVVLALPSALSAQTTTAPDGGVIIWTKGVPPQGATHKDDFGNHAISISHREVSGRVELHQTKADVLVIQSGEADLVTGGEILEPVKTAPNELQGTSIRGGVKRHVAAGDVIHIPVGVPHQFLLAPKTEITYLVVKVVDTNHAAH
jgi:mannose-6-phosphate isomerase-like protein (cupin superfamily)